MLVMHDRTLDWHDHLPIAAFGRNPQPGDALYLGFSDLSAGVPIAVAFHFQGPGNDANERTRIAREAAAQRAACRPVLPDIACEAPDGQPQPAGQPTDALPPHHSAAVVWEVLTGTAPRVWTRLD